MSKIKRNRRKTGVSKILKDSPMQSTAVEPNNIKSSITNQTAAEESGTNQSLGSRFTAFLKNRSWVVGLIALLSMGVLGAGLKYLEEDANREIALRVANKGRLNKEDQSFISKINPFLPAPSPTPTPQLSKEYIYAGSRLLAVEDANANAAPPADLAIWRPSNGEWWVMGSAGGSQQVTFAWGVAGDVPVPGDYDGDGKTDFSVFRPSNSTWYITNSGGGGGQIPFGLLYDIPAQADYDGDGRTDAAVFRPSTCYWYILKSSDGQLITQQFGLGGDIPAAADYDGDGKADIATWRNSDTKFYSLNSSNLEYQTTLTFSQTSNAPVSGDYDGDGRADYAIRNGANWIIRNSSNGQTQTISPSWEQSSDKEVQNDYDCDGKVDIAVWRSSNGNWYIRKSSNGQLRQEQWGIAGDIPVPAFYRR